MTKIGDKTSKGSGRLNSNNTSTKLCAKSLSLCSKKVCLLWIVLILLYQLMESHKSTTIMFTDSSNAIQTPIVNSVNDSNSIYAKCLEDVFNNLPMGTGRHQLKKKLKIPNGMITTFAHQYDAGNHKKWNLQKLLIKSIS